MKNLGRVSISTLLFSAFLGALAVFIYRRFRNPPAPPRSAKSPPLRIQPVNNPPEQCSPYQRRLPPLV
jgi:hypothetical protein